MEIKFDIHTKDQSVAARSQGLYKAEDLPSNSDPADLHHWHMTAPAAKLVILQSIRLDKDLDQRRPARDPPQPAQEGLDQRQPAKDQPARDDPEIQHIQHDRRSRHKRACNSIDCNDCMSILSQRRKQQDPT